MKVQNPVKFVNRTNVFLAVFVVAVLTLQAIILKFGGEYFDKLPMPGIAVPVAMSLIVAMLVALVYKPAYAGVAFAVILGLGIYQSYVQGLIE